MPEGLNKQVRRHAEASLDWRHNKPVILAYRMFDALKDLNWQGEPIPEPVIGFGDVTGGAREAAIPRDARYHYEGDDVSLQYHLDFRAGIDGVRLLVAVIKGMAYMLFDGSKNANCYHSTVFREHLKTNFGVIVNTKGDWTGFTDETISFAMVSKMTRQVLAEQGIAIDLPDTVEKATEQMKLSLAAMPEGSAGDPAPQAQEEPAQGQEEPDATVVTAPKPKLKHSSPMKKWACKCAKPTIVRCATALKATCLKCNQQFEMQGG